MRGPKRVRVRDGALRGLSAPAGWRGRRGVTYTALSEIIKTRVWLVSRRLILVTKSLKRTASPGPSLARSFWMDGFSASLSPSTGVFSSIVALAPAPAPDMRSAKERDRPNRRNTTSANTNHAMITKHSPPNPLSDPRARLQQGGRPLVSQSAAAPPGSAILLVLMHKTGHIRPKCAAKPRHHGFDTNENRARSRARYYANLNSFSRVRSGGMKLSGMCTRTRS